MRGEMHDVIWLKLNLLIVVSLVLTRKKEMDFKMHSAVMVFASLMKDKRNHIGHSQGEGSLHLLVLRSGLHFSQQLHPLLEVLPCAAQNPARRAPQCKAPSTLLCISVTT